MQPMMKEELSSSVSVQLFNGETQQLAITLANVGSEDIETLELSSKVVNTKGEFVLSLLIFNVFVFKVSVASSPQWKHLEGKRCGLKRAQRCFQSGRPLMFSSSGRLSAPGVSYALSLARHPSYPCDSSACAPPLCSAMFTASLKSCTPTL